MFVPEDHFTDHLAPIRLTVQQLSPDRRGRRRFMVSTVGGQVICSNSFNPLACAGATLLDRGFDPATQIVFTDAILDFEQHITLQEAAELDDVVVPFRRRASSVINPGGGDAA